MRFMQGWSYHALGNIRDRQQASLAQSPGFARVVIYLSTIPGHACSPLLLEELLARHPKLRVQVMHAGYPMIDNMLTLLPANSACVCRRGGADLELSHQGSESLHRTSGRCRIRRPRNVWYRPATWPKLMAYSISIIQNADYLTPQQKRDILYNNDARFLRLDGK